LGRLVVRILKPVLGAAWVVLTSRRQLNLPRWVRGRTFTDLHGHIVAWLDDHFATIERGAPWLHRFGVDVWDYCHGEVNSTFDFTLARRFRASAGCMRDVIVVYGFDGDVAGRLDQLAEALSTVGWRRTGPHPLRPWADADGALLTWQPNATVSYPPGMERKPAWGSTTLDPIMWMVWSSRGQTTSLGPNPKRTPDDTRNDLTVESRATEYWKLPDAALEQHDHALVVKVSLSYYSNPNPLARRHRIPRYLLPTRPVRRPG
jgi:hypothetical protein